MVRYYKIIKDGTVLEVQDNLQPVRFDERAGILLRRRLTDDPEGIISGDGQFIWQVDGWPELPKEKITATVTLTEIYKEEYENLKEKLDSGVIDPEPEEPDPSEPEQPEEVMTPVEMRLRIKELTTTVDTLTEKNEFLEECLMEMSEVIYA